MAMFPQIAQQDAPPEIAAIYADIRAVSGLPVVNLIWRYLATLPGVLPWAWAALAPLIASADMDPARQGIASAIALPAVPPRSAADWQGAGVSAEGIQAIHAMNDAYIRGNLTNLVAMTALRLCLEQPGAPAAILRAGEAVHPAPPPLDPLPRIDDLAPSLARQVRDLALKHERSADGMVPSLYLALARWPGVIAALPDWLAPLYDPAALLAVRSHTCGLAEAEATAMRPAPGPAPDQAAAMRPTLQRFTRLVIPDLVAVGLALRQVLPAPTGPSSYSRSG